MVVSFAPETGRRWLKLRNSRNASVSARLRAVPFHCVTNSSSVIGRPERGLQFGKGIVVEAKVRSTKLFFQNRCPGKERHGRPLRLIPRNQQDLAFPLKKSAGDVSGYVFGKSDGAVIESDVKGGAIQCHVANVVHP